MYALNINPDGENVMIGGSIPNAKFEIYGSRPSMAIQVLK
jgi:hypothetical protein